MPETRATGGGGNSTLPPDAETLVVDDLVFEVRRSAPRRTLQLTVDRGGELVLAAPAGLDPSAMRAFVRAKAVWIYAKLAEKRALQAAPSTRQFVTGEGFPYLGRGHRLLLVDAQDRPLKLEDGRFRLMRDEVARGRDHFIAWYTEHAKPWLRRRVDRWAAVIGVAANDVRVQDLGHRWASCGIDATLNFHWTTILLPRSAIDYVVVHELAHCLEANHTPAFWRHVARVLPDYESRKVWLAANGAEYASTL